MLVQLRRRGERERAGAREADGEKEGDDAGRRDGCRAVVVCVGGWGGGWGLSLFRRCYLVQPPTSAYHHGDAMATARCSTRKECNLERVKRLRASPDLIVSA